jgi:hypothetical protein
METNFQNEKERELWKIAKKRVGFKRHLASYIIVNAFLWAMWFIGDYSTGEDTRIWAAWPIWTSLGWGVGLAFSYFSAYGYNKLDAIEKEYEKLKQRY